MRPRIKSDSAKLPKLPKQEKAKTYNQRLENAQKSWIRQQQSLGLPLNETITQLTAEDK